MGGIQCDRCRAWCLASVCSFLKCCSLRCTLRRASAGVVARPAGRKPGFFFGADRMKVGRDSAGSPNHFQPLSVHCDASGRVAVNSFWWVRFDVTDTPGASDIFHKGQKYLARRLGTRPRLHALTGIARRSLEKTALSSSVIDATFSAQ